MKESSERGCGRHERPGDLPSVRGGDGGLGGGTRRASSVHRQGDEGQHQERRSVREPVFVVDALLCLSVAEALQGPSFRDILILSKCGLEAKFVPRI